MKLPFVPESFVLAMAWTLLHFLWQGAVIAGFLWIILQALRKRSAGSRYAAGCVALAITLAAPPVTFYLLHSQMYSAVNTIPAPEHSVEFRTPAENEAEDTLTFARPAGWNLRSQAQERGNLFSRIAPWMTLAWLTGVLLLSLRMFGGWIYTMRLRNHFVRPLAGALQLRFVSLLRDLRISRPVRLLESALVQVPTVIGSLRPVILVPASALAGLTPQQLESIILHELAHIRRYDYLVNLLQTAVEILLFYHPAVWWISRGIRTERENCCDDWALEISGDRISYAKALAAMETLRSMPQVAMAADGAPLLARIQRIIGHFHPEERSATWLPGMILLVSVGLTVPLFSNSKVEPEYRMQPAFQKESMPSTSEPAQVALAESAGIATEPNGSSDRPKSNKEDPDKKSAFVAEMAALGYTGLSVEELIALRDHNVTTDFVRDLQEHGYSGLSVEQMIALRDYGVSSKLIAQIRDSGAGPVSVEDLLRMQSHGVSGSFIRRLGELGYENLSADRLILAADHGVSPSYIRQFQSAGYKDLSIEELVRALDHGVKPGFVYELDTLGFPRMDIRQLIKLKDHGVGYSYVKEIQSLGFQNTRIEEFLRARDHGVDPEYIRAIRSLGYTDLTLEDYVRMRDHGVDPEYIESIRSAGYDDLRAEELVRLHDHGVDSSFIRNAASRGFTGLSMDQLIRLRDTGIIQQD